MTYQLPRDHAEWLVNCPACWGGTLTGGEPCDRCLAVLDLVDRALADEDDAAPF